jgi:uncharacterized protein (DUF2249 family)
MYLFDKMLAATGRLPSQPGGTSARRDISKTRQRKTAMSDTSAQSKISEIDVRSLVPAQRHAKIFQLVGDLSPGSSFVLINDHDPKPLYYQLEAEYPKTFSWTYLERGPQVWRVEIGRLAQAA